MSEYSVEEVRAISENFRQKYPGPIPGILNAYADLLERIKADEGAVPVAVRYFDGKNGDGSQHYVVYSLDRHRANVGAEPLFTHPPAQAAQVDALPDPLGCNDCTHPDCGRYNGPRSVECRAMLNNACARPTGNQPYHAPTAEPVTHNEDVVLAAIAANPDDAADQFAEPAAQDDGMCNADNPARRCVCREEFGRRVCGTASPAVTQDGWKVVPRDPTPEMIAACISAWQERLRQKAESGTLLCGGNPEKSFRENWTAMLDAAPSAPAGVPEWRVLVPREPTDAMCDAGDLPDTATAYDIYKAMLAAAPQPGESA